MASFFALLTEPVALLSIGLLFLSLVARKQIPSRWLRRLVYLLTFIIWFSATPLTTNFFVGFLENAVAKDDHCFTPQGDGIMVILAGGKSGHPADIEDVTRLQEASLKRVIEGVRIAQRSETLPVVVAGGAGSDIREADLMASLATRLGFPAQRIITERESKTTAETAENLARLDLMKNRHTVYLVTTAMHMLRASAAFERYDFTVCPIAIDYKYVDASFYEWFIPQTSPLRKSTEAYHELIGYVVYRLSGNI